MRCMWRRSWGHYFVAYSDIWRQDIGYLSYKNLNLRDDEDHDILSTVVRP